MLQLRTLGALDLLDATGRELRAVLQQPKRLGLLTYLAVAVGPRYVRRDVLLDLFWPELDQEHARAALRRALYFLRRALGDEVLDGRGDEEVRIRPGALWCDAVAFGEALAQDQRPEALQLYRGPFLEGFYIASAQGAEQWVDQTRGQLRQQAALACWTLAEAPATPATRAAQWGRQAAGILPDDENTVHRLLILLDRLNDRAGALQVYDEFARRLQLDLESEPSADLVQLAATIRARSRPVASSPGAVDAPVIVIGVLPFTIRGDPALAYLSEGLVDLLSTALDGVGDIRTVDPRALLAAVPGPGRDADSMVDPQLAHRLGVTHWVKGSLVATGPRIRLLASMHDHAGEIVARAEAQGDGESAVFDLVDEVVRQILTRRDGGPGERLARIAGLTTDSLPALRAWLQGEHEFRLGRYLVALDAYQRAAGLDGTFALAHYRLAGAAAASALIGPAREAASLALWHRGRLSPRDRLLVEAQHAWLNGRATEAERRYAAVVANHPDDLEAWALLADVLLHSNPYRGRSIREARDPLEQALRLDPGHVGTLIKLARLEALDGHTGPLEERVGQVLARSPAGDQSLGMRALLAYALRQPEARRRVAAELATAPALTIATAFTDLALYANDLPAVEALGRALTAVVRSTELLALSHLILAQLAAAQGRLDTALLDVERAEALDRPWGLEGRGLLLALPFLPWPDGAVTGARDTLRAWPAEEAAPNVSLPLSLHNQLHPHFRAYLLGILASRQGDVTGIAEAGEMLAELPVPEDGATLVERLGRSLEAELLLARGEPERALAALAGGPAETWFQFAVASPFYAGAFERWRRATLLQRLGRVAEARGWLDAIAQRSPWELPFIRAAVGAASPSIPDGQSHTLP